MKKHLRLKAVLCLLALSISLLAGCGTQKSADEPIVEEQSNNEKIAESIKDQIYSFNKDYPENKALIQEGMSIEALKWYSDKLADQFNYIAFGITGSYVTGNEDTYTILMTTRDGESITSYPSGMTAVKDKSMNEVVVSDGTAFYVKDFDNVDMIEAAVECLSIPFDENTKAIDTKDVAPSDPDNVDNVEGTKTNESGNTDNSETQDSSNNTAYNGADDTANNYKVLSTNADIHSDKFGSRIVIPKNPVATMTCVDMSTDSVAEHHYIVSINGYDKCLAYYNYMNVGIGREMCDSLMAQAVQLGYDPNTVGLNIVYDIAAGINGIWSVKAYIYFGNDIMDFSKQSDFELCSLMWETMSMKQLNIWKIPDDWYTHDFAAMIDAGKNQEVIDIVKYAVAVANEAVDANDLLVSGDTGDNTENTEGSTN